MTSSEAQAIADQLESEALTRGAIDAQLESDAETRKAMASLQASIDALLVEMVAARMARGQGV